ncbi:GH92 family glycosyl hydrolase [Paracidobacterium acidisoli]|uniref:Glycoside hydrolase family 92 protein n=1 Tax=Paracidobacterium acidisoli TaxID=2303751 RepID=A0A372IJG9_9BACT|nr:GH92 family glycosyl hydrolase [Paracidobacterium acidisoli]MBT9333295.1 GH92 family glycosyl hydrolase [Paracidobacterium acidisoli]
MITRRRFLETLSALSASSLLPSRAKAESTGTSALSAPVSKSPDDLTQHVNIAIGTGGHGHTYPGATMPFGMVQLSPDTYNDGWDWCSGYHYSDTSIMGFSHTHLSGTGCGDLLDFLLMPGTGQVKLDPGSRENPEEGYRSRFSHDDEIAHPGYYSVLLKDYGIHAELSATERAGIHKYTFPESDSAHFILDLAHVDQKDPGVLWSELKLLNDTTIIGGRSTSLWANGRQVYFAMQFSKPFTSAEIFSEGKSLGETWQASQSKSLKCVLHHKATAGEVILVKVGISGVSADGALKNLRAEIPGWDFCKVSEDAKAAWQKHLAKIRIETGNNAHKTIFYTALYHMMVAPTLFDDVDGQYRGMDGQIHQLPAGMHNYSTYSLWDTYRAVHPMYTLFLPERVPDLVNCLIRMANESPAGMPVWPLYAKETGTMTGYHSAAVIAEAAIKGFPGLNLSDAWKPMNQRAMVDDYRGLGYYRSLGYIPCDKVDESVSKTLEYTYDDWAVGHVARLLNRPKEAQALFKRSRNYRNVFDAEDRFMRPRLESGDWAEPFDPIEMGHSKQWRDFTESNSWQTTFAIQHDPKGYINIFGGREAFVTKLDALFNQSSKLPPDAPPDIAGLVGQYAHGNEPSHHIAYLYNYAGAPWKTQARVRSLLETMYRNDPDGMAGNEDCGQMSAWYVISALGFYAVDPVSGNYVFGTPLFDHATIQLADDKKLVIEVKRESPEQQYIQSILFNGKNYEKTWFSHADIREGGTIVFTMGGQPNREFGVTESAAPPSLTD